MELQKIYSDSNIVASAFAESRIGGRSENQDSFGWKDTKRGYLVTVCDGMGGGPGGKAASTIAVREIIEGIDTADESEETVNVIIKAVRRANMAIIEVGNEDKKLKGMGSTATVLLLTERCAYVAHVGDSRVYQLRGKRKVFRTFDHSMVFEMVAQGIITEEQARLSAQSNIITRALGIEPDLKVEVHQLPYERGDRFLLCSDGIHGTMPEKELIRLATSRKRRLGVVTDDLATIVDNTGMDTGGGHDNLTLAIVEVKKDSKLKPKMTRQTKIIMMGLVALIALSLALNIVLLCRKNPGVTVTNEKGENVALLKDSLAKQNAKIVSLTDSLSKINKKNK